MDRQNKIKVYHKGWKGVQVQTYNSRLDFTSNDMYIFDDKDQLKVQETLINKISIEDMKEHIEYYQKGGI